MDNYISRLDEIDKWLFDSFGILPGACSSTENLRHTTARMVAEALWPKKDLALTWEDVMFISQTVTEIINSIPDKPCPYTPGLKEICEETLKRFNDQREKK